MKNKGILLLILNLFLIAVYIVITWNNIYASGPAPLSIVNHVYNVFLELLILNALLVLTGSIHWILAKVLFTLLVTLYFIVLILQSFSIDISGSSLVLAAFYNANESSLLINKHTLSLAIISGSIFLLLMSFQIRNVFPKKAIVVYLSAFIVIYPLALKYKHSDSFKQYGDQAELHQFVYPVSPLRDFYKIATLYLREQEENDINMPSSEDLQTAVRFNLSVDPQNYYPFLKKKIYDSNLRKSAITDRKKPNVIVFFVESLSARLIGAYGNNYENLTPNIDEFAKSSTVVRGYYNHTTPTAPGLFGQHCSLYPLISGKKMKNRDNCSATINLSGQTTIILTG